MHFAVPKKVTSIFVHLGGMSLSFLFAIFLNLIHENTRKRGGMFLATSNYTWVLNIKCLLYFLYLERSPFKCISYYYVSMLENKNSDSQSQMIAFWIFFFLNLVVFAFYDTYQRVSMPRMLGDIIINFTILLIFF